MKDFIFSLNATLPVFFVIMIGYLLKRRGYFDENFASKANKFNFNVTLPALLFQDIAKAPIAEVFDWSYLLYCMIVTTISFWGIWGVSKILIKDKTMIGAFVQGSFRGSAAVLGIAFIQNMYGDSGMAPLMIVGAVPLFNIYSVLVLTFESDNAKSKNLKGALLNIITNPIIFSIGAGLIGSVLGIYKVLPMVFTKTIYNFAAIATPLALVTIGCGFEGRKAIGKWKATLIASVIKLLLLPGMFLPVGIVMGFRGQELIAILIMLGAPSTVSCYIMAKNMNNDGVLASSIIVATTLFSSVTLTLWIFLLKIGGVI